MPRETKVDEKTELVYSLTASTLEDIDRALFAYLDEELDIFCDTNKGFEKVPDGSWWGSLRVQNDKVWQMIKENVIRGFSVEGMFAQNKAKNLQEKIINKIRKVINEYKILNE